MVALYKEQLEAVEKFTDLIGAAVNPGGIAWFDMGQGKTRIAIETWRRSRLQFLFIAARRAAFEGWREEIQKCGVHCIIREVKECKGLGWKFGGHSFVVLQTPDSLHVIPEEFPWDRTLLVLDELYLFGNPQAQRSERAYKISNRAQFTLGLSATIMPARNNTSIYGQARAVGLQQHIGGSLTNFRSEYQHNVFSPFTPNGEWVNKPGSVKRLMSNLAPYVAVHFPDKLHRNIRTQLIHVKRSAEQAKALIDLQKTWSLHGEKFSHTLSIARKIQSISNGWSENPDNSDELHCYECSKFERLALLVDELVAADKRCVIWCAFRNDVEYLAMHLKHPTLVFVGQQTFDSKAWATGKYPVVLATVANGSSVNHFGNVEVGIYYSLSYRWLELQQSQGRHERKDSTHAGAFYYFMLTRDTLDQGIYDTVTQSRNVEANALRTAIDLLTNKNTP